MELLADDCDMDLIRNLEEVQGFNTTFHIQISNERGVVHSATTSMCFHILEKVVLTKSVRREVLSYALDFYDTKNFALLHNLKYYTKYIFDDGLLEAISRDRNDLIPIILRRITKPPIDALKECGKRRDLECIKLIVDKFHGINAYTSDERVIYPVHAFVLSNDVESVKNFIEQKYKVGTESFRVALDNQEMLEVLMASDSEYKSASFYYAVINGKLELASWLLDNGADTSYNDYLTLKWMKRNEIGMI